MTEKYILERAIKYLNRLLQNKPIKASNEIEEVKRLREELNSMIYQKGK